MNGLTACMHRANYVTDFKERVAYVVKRMMTCHMHYLVAKKVFRNFMQKHWQAGDMRKPELMKCLYGTWRFLDQSMYRNPTSKHGNQFGQPRQPGSFGRFSDEPPTLDSPPRATQVPV